MYFLTIVIFACLSLGKSQHVFEPGPTVRATKGEVWPKPQAQTKDLGYFVVRAPQFRFKPIGQNCKLLEHAFQRYWDIIFKSSPKLEMQNIPISFETDPNFLGYLGGLGVYITDSCIGNLYPSMNMDEKYDLNIKNQSSLKAKTIWGVLRGLETFSQLIHKADDQTTLIINATYIHDFPRFPHRGLLIGSGRNYVPVHILLKMLDAMTHNKMNVFHWALTDDHSFPFQSLAFPELSDNGAFHPSSHVYTEADVSGVKEYARLRGIRVIPQFNTPAHTRSWGAGVPGLLTPCEGDLDGKFGPMDPTSDFVYTFLKEFFEEVRGTFDDEYVHLGGNEVMFKCWESNANIAKFMKTMNIQNKYPALQNFFTENLVKITGKLQLKNIVYEEAFTHGAKLPKSTIVHVWKRDWKATMDAVTKAGHYVVLSSCWHLDRTNSKNWTQFYECEATFEGRPDKEKLILGGEVYVGDEGANEYNIGPRAWPKASAAAEKLWSAQNADTQDGAAKRLEEHTCRMIARGIPAGMAGGAGACL